MLATTSAKIKSEDLETEAFIASLQKISPIAASAFRARDHSLMNLEDFEPESPALALQYWSLLFHAAYVEYYKHPAAELKELLDHHPMLSKKIAKSIFPGSEAVEFLKVLTQVGLSGFDEFYRLEKLTRRSDDVGQCALEAMTNVTISKNDRLKRDEFLKVPRALEFAVKKLTYLPDVLTELLTLYQGQLWHELVAMGSEEDYDEACRSGVVSELEENIPQLSKEIVESIPCYAVDRRSRGTYPDLLDESRVFDGDKIATFCRGALAEVQNNAEYVRLGITYTESTGHQRLNLYGIDFQGEDVNFRRALSYEERLGALALLRDFPIGTQLIIQDGLIIGMKYPAGVSPDPCIDFLGSKYPITTELMINNATYTSYNLSEEFVEMYLPYLKILDAKSSRWGTVYRRFSDNNVSWIPATVRFPRRMISSYPNRDVLDVLYIFRNSDTWDISRTELSPEILINSISLDHASNRPADSRNFKVKTIIAHDWFFPSDELFPALAQYGHWSELTKLVSNRQSAQNLADLCSYLSNGGREVFPKLKVFEVRKSVADSPLLDQFRKSYQICGIYQ